MPSFVEIGPAVSEKKILKCFTIYGHGGHLGHVTWFIYKDIGPPFLKMLLLKFGFNWPREKIFEEVDDRRQTDGRTPGACLSCKLSIIAIKWSVKM